MSYDCVVIGAGAAGMMAALSAAQKGNRVLILEKNEKAGKKIYITGKGRCNVTNAGDTNDFFDSVVNNEKFLYSSIYSFDAFSVMDLLEKNGCPLKVERGNRVFPVSDHASDVIRALVGLLKDQKVEIRYHCNVKKVLTKECEETPYKSIVTGVKLASGEVIDARNVIVATGGLSYPTTGSTGDGFTFAKELEIEVVECKPSLVPLYTQEKWCADLMGLSLKNVGVSMEDEKGKRFYDGFGEMLFTHFGVSGPLILSGSCHYVKKFSGKKVKLYIDLKPALDEETLDKRLLKDFEENKNKIFGNALNDLFPSKLIPVMVKLSGINSEKRVHDITREERLAFIRLMKRLPLTIVKTAGFNEAIITMGGVSVKEINPSTMESKKVKQLYFAGEVLDVDAYTGGYNLQIAWATGHLAGDNIGG